MIMKQLGNLAIVCAQRENTLLMVQHGRIKVVTYRHGGYITLHADWDDDDAISAIIRDLNFGRFAVKAA